MKFAGKHADDGVRRAVQSDRLAEDVCSSAVALLPCRIAQEERSRRTGQILPRPEIAAKNRRDAEGSKESVAHAGSSRRFGAVRATERESTLRVGFKRIENGVELFP